MIDINEHSQLTTVHCKTCDSKDIVMYNAVCKWDVNNQKWVFSVSYDPMYQCADCGSDSSDCIEKENNNA